MRLSFGVTNLKADKDVLYGLHLQVGNDGTVPFRTGELIAFSYLVT